MERKKKVKCAHLDEDWTISENLLGFPQSFK